MRSDTLKKRWFPILAVAAGLFLPSLACSSIPFLAPTPTPTATSTPTPTKTPTPTETPTITPTFTPSMTPTQSYLDWPVVLADSFDDNTNNWFVGPSNDEFANSVFSITDGQYLVDMTALKGFFWWLTPSVKNLNNFYVTVEVENKTGPVSSDYGLVCRLSSRNKYYFAIAAEYQEYSFMVLNNNQWTTIIDWTSSNLITASGSNQVSVLAKGTSFTFFINGEMVNQAEDSTLKSGKVGIAVELAKAGDTALIAFDNFQVQAP
jgi:hypothetical protein